MIEESYEELFETILWEGQRENVDKEWAEELGSECNLPSEIGTGQEQTDSQVETVLKKITEAWPVTGGLQYAAAAATVKSIRQQTCDLFIPILSKEMKNDTGINKSWVALLVFFMTHDAGNQHEVIQKLTELNIPQAIITSLSEEDIPPRLVRAVSKMLPMFFNNTQPTHELRQHGKVALMTAATQFENLPLILSEIFEALSHISADLSSPSDAKTIQTAMMQHYQSEGLLMHLATCCEGSVSFMSQESLLFVISKYRSSDNVDILKAYLKLLVKNLRMSKKQFCNGVYPLLCEMLNSDSCNEVVVEILEVGFSTVLPAGKSFPPEDFVSIAIRKLMAAYESGNLSKHNYTITQMVHLLLGAHPGVMFSPSCQDFFNFLSLPALPLAKVTLSIAESELHTISNNPDILTTVFTLLSQYCCDPMCDQVVVHDILKVLVSASFTCLNAFPYLDRAKRQLLMSELVALCKNSVACCPEEAAHVIVAAVTDQIKMSTADLSVAFELMSTLVTEETSLAVVTFALENCSLLTMQQLNNFTMIWHNAIMMKPDCSLNLLCEAVADTPVGDLHHNTLSLIVDSLSSLVHAQSAPRIAELLLSLAPFASDFPKYSITLTDAVTAYPAVVADIVVSYVSKNPKAFSQYFIWSALEPIMTTSDCNVDLIVSIFYLLAPQTLSSSSLGAPALLISILGKYGSEKKIYDKLVEILENTPKVIKNGEALCKMAGCLLVNGKHFEVSEKEVVKTVTRTIEALEHCDPSPPASGELVIVNSIATVLSQLLPSGCPDAEAAKAIPSSLSLDVHPLLTEAWIYAFPDSLFVADSVISILNDRAITTESEQETNDLNEQTKTLLQGFLLSVSGQADSPPEASVPPKPPQTEEPDSFKKLKTEKVVRIICTLMKKFVRSAAIQEKGLELLKCLSTTMGEAEYESHIPGTPDFANNRQATPLLTVIDVLSGTMSQHPSSVSIVRGCASAILKYIHCVSPLNTRRLTTTLTNAIADHMHSERSVILIMSSLAEVVSRFPVLIRANVIQSAVSKYTETCPVLNSFCNIAESLIRCSSIQDSDKQKMVDILNTILDSSFIREPSTVLKLSEEKRDGRLRVIINLLGMISSIAQCGTQLKRAVTNLGILPRLVNVISKNGNSAPIAAAGCTAIAQLSYDTPFITKELVEVSAVSCVILAMTTFHNDEGVQIAGCSALSGLAFNNAEGQQQILLQGGPQHVISALQENSFSLKLLEIGCLVLGTLSWNDAIRQEVAALGGMSAIVEAMTRYPNEAALQKNGSRAMSQLAYNNNANRVLLQSVGAVPVVLKALSLHSTNDRVILHAIVALTYMSWRTDAVIHEIVEGGGIPLVEQAAQAARAQNNDKLRTKAEHLISILNRSASESPSVGPSNDSPVITPGLFPLRTLDRCRDTRWQQPAGGSPNTRWARQGVGMYS